MITIFCYFASVCFSLMQKWWFVAKKRIIPRFGDPQYHIMFLKETIRCCLLSFYTSAQTENMVKKATVRKNGD